MAAPIPGRCGLPHSRGATLCNHRMDKKSGRLLGGGAGSLTASLPPPPPPPPARVPRPPSAPDDTQSLRKGADKAWTAAGRKARLKSLAKGLTHRFFTSCAVRERRSGAPAPEESGYSPRKTIKASGTAHRAAGEKVLERPRQQRTMFESCPGHFPAV